jgi:hypothetical protein
LQASADVVINEVFYDPTGVDTEQEWIELYNNGDAIQLDGYCLYASGEHYVFNPFLLNADAYVLVHWNADGTDTPTDLYTGTADWSNMGNSSGSVALWNTHESHTKETIVDYMEYGAGGKPFESTAVSAGIWTADDFAADVDEGHSLEYDGSGDTGSDWFDQAVPTPGADNALPVTLSYFEARYFDNVIIIRWVTESETNNLGFDIYRGKSKYGPFEKINSSRIAGAGTTASQSKYEYIDEIDVAGNQYFYYIENLDFSGARSRSETIPAISGPFGKVKPEISRTSLLEQPVKFDVFQNFPNPFNPETWIPFQLPEAAYVTVKIYNVFGQTVRTIDLGQKGIGHYLSKDESIHWDGRNQNGELVPSGVYFYQFRAGKFMAMKKMLLVK